jgi:pseudouridine-5'-phosphate glycosidase
LNPRAQGVAVLAYGADDFPAFFAPRSGCAAPARVDSPAQAAALIRAGRRLQLDSAMLIGPRARLRPVLATAVPVHARSMPLLWEAWQEHQAGEGYSVVRHWLACGRVE